MVERVDRDRGRSRRHRGWRRGRRATDQLGAAGPRHGRRRRVPHAVPDDARRPDRWSGPPRRDRHPAQHHLRHPGAPPRRGLRAGGGPGLRTRPTRRRHHRWDRPDRSRHRPQRHPLLRRPGTGRRRAAAAVPALDQGRRHRPHPRARAGRGPHARPLTPRDPGGPDPAERRQPVRLRPGPRPAPGGHGPRRRARVGRSVELAVALVLAGGAVLAAGSPAYAHATLVATSPANGAELDAPPAEIRLRFSERVTVAPDGVTLRDADGVVVETPPAATAAEDPTTVVLPVPGDLPQGAYVVVYRVVSEDSHPVAGALTFGVGVAAQPLDEQDVIGGDPAVSAVFALARWTSYAGLGLLAGSLAVFVLCWPGGWADRRARLLVAAGWVASLAGGAAVLLLQGPYGSGRPLADLADPRLLQATLDTDYGRYVVARLGVVAAAAALVLSPLRHPVRWQRVGALAVAVAMPATWVGTGHANAADNPLDPAMDVAHLVAMSTWFSGLVLPVACGLPRSSPVPAEETVPMLRRYSLLATGAVVTLVGTGTYVAWRRLGTLEALFGTPYGRLLAFKLAGMAVLLWLGALSRSVVQRRYAVDV